MTAHFPLPAKADKPEAVADSEIWEPFNVGTDHVAGASHIRVLPDGCAHLQLWRYHLSSNGDMERVLVARLVMPREVMREVALAMLSASMLDEERIAEMKRRMT